MYWWGKQATRIYSNVWYADYYNYYIPTCCSTVVILLWIGCRHLCFLPYSSLSFCCFEKKYDCILAPSYYAVQKLVSEVLSKSWGRPTHLIELPCCSQSTAWGAAAVSVVRGAGWKQGMPQVFNYFDVFYLTYFCPGLWQHPSNIFFIKYIHLFIW